MKTFGGAIASPAPPPPTPVVQHKIGVLCSAELTIVANIAIVTGPAFLRPTRSSVMILICYNSI